MEKATKFLIYCDFDGGYRWRLRSLTGMTIAASETGHQQKSGCEQELERWRLEYPDVPIRDATIRNFETRLPLKT